jgi:hypothetical protein
LQKILLHFKRLNEDCYGKTLDLLKTLVYNQKHYSGLMSLHCLQKTNINKHRWITGNQRNAMRSPLKILITSRKGGVGKSSIAVNLAAYFARIAGKKTSLVDFDYQRTASQWVADAPKIGIDCRSFTIPNSKGAGNALLEAKEA